MNTIDLDCPHCSERLQIDIAYAGSVCRCDACGQLMKVPKATDAQAIGDRPSSPDDPSPVAPATTNASTNQTPATTRSHLIPIAITAGVLGIAIVALIVYALSGSSQPAGPPPTADSIAVHGYDPNVNPLRLDVANFLGIPLDSYTMLAVDTSSSSRPWFEMFKSIASQIIVHHRGTGGIAIAYWREEDPDEELLPLPNRPITIRGALGLSRMLATIADAKALGDCEPESAIDAMERLRQQPEQIIFVTSQQLDEERIAQISEGMRKTPNMRVDIVTIDIEIPELKAITDRHGGIYISLPLQRLEKWFAQAYPQPPNADTTSGP